MQSLSQQLFSLILPLTVLVIIPLAIGGIPVLVFDALGVIGLGLFVIGLVSLILVISVLIRFGKGTLAPWNPTKQLVVTGPYAYVRNPMISSVLTILLGEAFAFHSDRIAIWLLVFFVITWIHFSRVEEPGLVKRFGESYIEYKKNVPRWIPRSKPWRPVNDVCETPEGTFRTGSSQPS